MKEAFLIITLIAAAMLCNQVGTAQFTIRIPKIVGNMKNICAILFLLVFSIFAFAQTQPKTVTDFYSALPDSVNGIAGTQDLDGYGFEGYFFFYSNERNESKSAIAKYRKSLIKIEDVKNGYLRLEGTWEGWVEIALFKKTNGAYLVAISQVGCGPGCSGNVMFVTYNKGKWTNVTTQVFPVNPSSNENYFKLPRVGTTIELHGGEDCGADEACQSRQKLAEFKWNKTKFVK